MNIGIFDSGVGGLAIYEKLITTLPAYNFVYLGDTAHVPYGDREEQEIYELTKQSVDRLFREFDCAIVILACNTATAVALRKLQQEYLPQHFPDRRILGIIKPTIEFLTDQHWQQVSLIATTATVHSNAYGKELENVAPEMRLIQHATPELVPLIEAKGSTLRKLPDTNDELNIVFAKLVHQIQNDHSEALILACTHYEHIEKLLQKLLPIPVVSQSRVVTQKFQDYLQRHPELETKLDKGSQRQEIFT